MNVLIEQADVPLELLRVSFPGFVWKDTHVLALRGCIQIYIYSIMYWFA